MTTAVAILTRNAGPTFRETLALVRAQEPPPDELVIVDSGSSDDTIAIAREHGASIHEIPVGEFDFGRTRDLAWSLTSSDLILSLSQDVIPKDATWLRTLTEPFLSDSGLAFASARCEARDPESMFLWQRLGRFYFTREMTRFRARYGVPVSNANSCARRTVWAKLGHGPMPIAEDLLFQKRVIEAGFRTTSIDIATAWHQHQFDFASAFKRAWNEGLAARHLDIPYGLFDAARDGLRVDLWLTLVRQMTYGRVRSPADLLYPWLRPVAVFAGRRFGHGYWR